MHYGNRCYKEKWFKFKTLILVLLTNIKFFILVSRKLDCKCFNTPDTYYYMIDEGVYVAMTLKRKLLRKKCKSISVFESKEIQFLVCQASKLDGYLTKKYKFRIRDEYLTFNEYTKLALLLNRRYFTDCNIIYDDIIAKGVNCNKVVDIRYIRIL